jgi:hypothetical protein
MIHLILGIVLVICCVINALCVALAVLYQGDAAWYLLCIGILFLNIYNASVAFRKYSQTLKEKQ